MWAMLKSQFINLHLLKKNNEFLIPDETNNIR